MQYPQQFAYPQHNVSCPNPPFRYDEAQKPWEIVPENEAKIVFCPVMGLPIVMERRVRTHPGFHILSQEAGNEAQKNGKYEAFGGEHACENIELLHKNDEVFCTEDKKSFLTEASLQYYKYVHYELEEQKNERQLINDRNEQRKRRRGEERERCEKEKKLRAAKLKTEPILATKIEVTAPENKRIPMKTEVVPAASGRSLAAQQLIEVADSPEKTRKSFDTEKMKRKASKEEELGVLLERVAAKKTILAASGKTEHGGSTASNNEQSTAMAHNVSLILDCDDFDDD